MDYQKTPKAPSLVSAPEEYSIQYQNQLNNVFRLYFNELDDVSRSLIQKTNNLSVMNWLSTGSF